MSSYFIQELTFFSRRILLHEVPIHVNVNTFVVHDITLTI